MFATPLLLIALVGPQAESEVEAAWGDVELPVGFHLDLSTGWVSSRAPAEAVQGVIWDGDSLRGPALLQLVRGSSERSRLERGEGGAPQGGALAEVGDEWAYELGELGWGYLRVLSRDSGRIRLERAHGGTAEVDLVRVPMGISWSSPERVVELSWARDVDEDAEWLVERRAVRVGGTTRWEVVARTRRPWWTDAEPVVDLVLEYRVRRVGARMGSRVRAVAGGVADGPVLVPQGSGINALTGEVGGARSDIRLEYINPKGVQIGPGEGVVMRTLALAGRDAWELPRRDAPGYGPQRYFLSEGRDLAVYLPEGLYARLSLGEIGDGSVGLSVSVAIDGGRVLLPAPVVLAAEGRADGGAEVTVEVVSGFAGLGLGEPILILEREVGFDSGEWAFVTEEITSGREKLVDLKPEMTGPCRYRSRVRLGPFGPSPPSAPISVLLGDDGGAQTDAWIREAVGELGRPEYERRQRARELLAVVGARARPQLLEVVSSENPEQAAAARELLSGLSQGEEVSKPDQALVPEVLLQRASERGLREDALPGFLSANALRRAAGALQAVDAEAVREHLDLLAEYDPLEFVRDAASLALRLPPRVSMQTRSATLGWQSLSEVALELELQQAPDPMELADALVGVVAEGVDAWTSLVALQIAGDLEGAAGALREEDAAISRARLALSLLRVRAEEPDAPASFLTAALDVVRDPLVRQRAARSFAASVFEPTEHEREPLRVEAGDWADLAAILDECRRSGEGEHIIVPEGIYEAPGGALASLRTGGDGVHIVGEGEVVIHASIIVDEGGRVALENIQIAPRTGTGILITAGELLLIDCTLTPFSMGIQATDSLVALSNTVVADPARAGKRGGAISLRLAGMSALFARASRIESSASCVHGARFVYLDGCAFASVDRSAVEGQGRMEVFAERTVLRGGYSALTGAGTGALDGVVLESEGHAALRVGDGLHICREHTSGGDEPGELWTKGISTGCTFE